jgi:putative transposase
MARSDSGKPWHNVSSESFNGKFRDERLLVEWFRSRAKGWVLIEAWRQHYNPVRLQASLRNKTPYESNVTMISDTHEAASVQ